MKTRDVFVENLVRLRKAKGLSQSDFAPLVGFESLRGYQRYEQGQAAPTPDILDRFAHALGCEPWELTKPEIGQPKEADLWAAAEALSRLAELPEHRRSVVLALIFRDFSLLKQPSNSVRQACLALLKAP